MSLFGYRENEKGYPSVQLKFFIKYSNDEDEMLHDI